MHAAGIAELEGELEGVKGLASEAAQAKKSLAQVPAIRAEFSRPVQSGPSNVAFVFVCQSAPKNPSLSSAFVTARERVPSFVRVMVRCAYMYRSLLRFPNILV